MDESRYEKRRHALATLVKKYDNHNGRGGIAFVARTIGTTPSVLSRMLYEPDKKGRKRIGEDTAAKISAKFPAWFDEQPAKTTPVCQEPTNGYSGNVEPIASRRPALTELQAQLIEITRGMNDIGVAMLIERATMLASQYPLRARANLQN